MNQQATRNKLLAALPTEELELIQQHATHVRLNGCEVLYDAGQPIQHVYFVTDGIVSILSLVSASTGVETVTIGREGMVGMVAFHGETQAPERTLVQVPGAAYRLDVATFRDLLPRLPGLNKLLNRFAVVMFSLASQNSACNRKHSIEARCARWLLTVADRLDTTTMELTHDFVAQMLGVRRASVTESLGSFEKRGFVQTGRGRITVTDHTGLEGIACGCYGIIRGAVGRMVASS
ncbi:MAG TPA: Crp/Fnr family transcriptional regulator [Gemmatimonadaceae bacterium]